jgi:hypothetical protein
MSLSTPPAGRNPFRPPPPGHHHPGGPYAPGPVPPGYAPPPRRSAGKVVGVLAGALLAVVVGLAVAAGSIGPGSVPASSVEQQITTKYQLDAGQTVHCPSSLPAEQGARITCRASDGSGSIDLLVTATDVHGDQVDFTVTPQN